MPTDKFTVSVPPNTLVNLAEGRPWRAAGSIIHRIQVAAPDAATNFRWDLSDGSDVPFKDQERTGATISYDFNAFLDVGLQAEREWSLNVRHNGASSQNISVMVEWE